MERLFVLVCVLNVAGAAVFVGCPRPPAPPLPPPGPDAWVVGTSCASACAHMIELGCIEEVDAGVIDIEGNTCTAVCENVQSSGVIEWNLDCRAAITSCAQIDACEGTVRRDVDLDRLEQQAIDVLEAAPK